ncbi:AAA family ATPase [Tessaracoccus oleiagri]|uniref:AAA family ATPase n=1 Tax=Tessaracoccus oleiagri TaxID=686624 RepID=UPI003CCBA87B
MAIVAALSSDAELLILDEPTSGLDPLMENVFQEVVVEAKGRGSSVLLSSHILAEVESLADRLSIIRDGRVAETGTLADLRGRTRTTIHAEVVTLPAHASLDALEDVRIDGNRLWATVESSRISAALETLLPLGVTALTVEPPSLESLFLRLYEGEEGER